MVEETVLVTGGCGFVGHRMVASLKADGHSVRVLDIPRAEFACVENLTCAPNAVNLQAVPPDVSGFRVVAPGQQAADAPPVLDAAARIAQARSASRTAVPTLIAASLHKGIC